MAYHDIFATSFGNITTALYKFQKFNPPVNLSFIFSLYFCAQELPWRKCSLDSMMFSCVAQSNLRDSHSRHYYTFIKRHILMKNHQSMALRNSELRTYSSSLHNNRLRGVEPLPTRYEATALTNRLLLLDPLTSTLPYTILVFLFKEQAAQLLDRWPVPCLYTTR